MWMVETIRGAYNSIYERRLINKLQLDSFSIFASNCSAGVIYHRLHHEFQSPTINLFIPNNEFVEFALNLKMYMSEPLVFIKTDNAYPVATLGGQIHIHFNHYSDEEVAYKKWNERKGRIDWKHLYFILYERDGVSLEDLERLKELKCSNLIVFSENRHPEYPFVLTYRPPGKVFNESMMMNRTKLLKRWTFEKFFDYVDWLNAGIIKEKNKTCSKKQRDLVEK